jgi:hypothetical protein
MTGQSSRRQRRCCQSRRRTTGRLRQLPQCRNPTFDVVIYRRKDRVGWNRLCAATSSDGKNGRACPIPNIEELAEVCPAEKWVPGLLAEREQQPTLSVERGGHRGHRQRSLLLLLLQQQRILRRHAERVARRMVRKPGHGSDPDGVFVASENN